MTFSALPTSRTPTVGLPRVRRNRHCGRPCSGARRCWNRQTPRTKSTAPPFGFVFDFCGVEINRDTGTVRVDKYVSLHDAGRILNPALLDGQVCGGFAMAVGAALYERLVYAEDGGFLTGSLLDYALPTASMIPELEILHQETPSPVTPLGAKGVAEGNSMSTPVCIANAVADALGVAEVSLPLTPERLLEMLRRGGQ